jgi:hypothetical protein
MEIAINLYFESITSCMYYVYMCVRLYIYIYIYMAPTLCTCSHHKGWKLKLTYKIQINQKEEETSKE